MAIAFERSGVRKPTWARLLKRILAGCLIVAVGAIAVWLLQFLFVMAFCVWSEGSCS